MALPRITARARRLMRLLVVIACFSFFGAAIFVIGMIIHPLGSVSFASWGMFRDISGFFAIIGALYGSIIALDRSADSPWPSGKFFRRVNAPFARNRYLFDSWSVGRCHGSVLARHHRCKLTLCGRRCGGNSRMVWLALGQVRGLLMRRHNNRLERIFDSLAALAGLALSAVR